MRFDVFGCPPPRPLHPRLRPLHPRLRSFPSVTPLRPPLRSLFSYSEGRRGAADGKRRSRRGSALLWSTGRLTGTIGGAVRSTDEAGSSGCAGWLAAHQACPVESLAGWSSGSVLAGAPELCHRPRARRGTRDRGRQDAERPRPTPSASGHSPCGRSHGLRSRTDPERVGALGGPHRIPILVLWEDRSAPHPAASAPQPRNHAEIAERIRGAGPNDPPRAPFPASNRLRGSLLRLMGPRDPCGGSGRGDAARPHPERPAGGPRRRGPGRRRGGKRWPARDFRVRRRRCTSGERRHCATS